MLATPAAEYLLFMLWPVRLATSLTDCRRGELCIHILFFIIVSNDRYCFLLAHNTNAARQRCGTVEISEGGQISRCHRVNVIAMAGELVTEALLAILMLASGGTVRAYLHEIKLIVIIGNTGYFGARGLYKTINAKCALLLAVSSS
jgi:hypothetical protein